MEFLLAVVSCRGETQCVGNVLNVSSTRVVEFDFLSENLDSGCLRASFCKYGESGDSFKIFNFFIFRPNNAFSELFSKIQLKDPKALEFFQNREKFENRHFGLPPPLKIDKNDAFSFRSCW